jgi:hypothetical protein
MKETIYPNFFILWIEDLYEEYDPLFDDLQELVW